MRYIRLKCGRIELNDYAIERQIVAEADTIEALVMPNDLVEVDGVRYYRVRRDKGPYLETYDWNFISKNRITAIFANRADDQKKEGLSFVEVARRKNKDSEWELL